MTRRGLSLVLLLVSLTGCAVLSSLGKNPDERDGVNSPPALPSQTVSSAETGVGGYRDLINELSDAGAAVEPAGSVEQPFFSVPGQIIRVNGQDLQVFEFESEEARQAQSSQISHDGSTIGTSMVSWIAPPHFWAKGNIILLYLGQDQETISMMNQVMGEAITQP